MQSETCLPIWIYVMDWRGLCFRDFIGYLSEYGSSSRWSILIVSIEYVSFWLDMFLVVVNVLHLFQTSSAWKSYLIIVDFVLKVLLSNKLKITKTFCLTFIWEGAEGIYAILFILLGEILVLFFPCSASIFGWIEIRFTLGFALRTWLVS